jgi:DNA-nicking Smr family endonuclease
MGRRRSLSEEEHALWSAYVRLIDPLHERRHDPQPHDSTELNVDNQPSHPSPGAAAPEMRPREKAARLAPLDRRLKQRVARGRETIDGRLDLHGLTQEQAYASLLSFLRRTQADGGKMVLVVTGKGKGAMQRQPRARESEHGVLRRSVPLWLALPEFRALVVGFGQAHVGHGGEGALYVRLRRGR